MDSDKKKALELALGKIEKDFGKGSLMRLGDKPDEKIPLFQQVHYLLIWH